MFLMKVLKLKEVKNIFLQSYLRSGIQSNDPEYLDF